MHVACMVRFLARWSPNRLAKVPSIELVVATNYCQVHPHLPSKKREMIWEEEEGGWADRIRAAKPGNQIGFMDAGPPFFPNSSESVNQNLHLSRIFLMYKRGPGGREQHEGLWVPWDILSEAQRLKFTECTTDSKWSGYYYYALLNSLTLIGVFLLRPGLLIKAT